MLEFSLPITPSQMEELEALFCEELQQHWLLFQKDQRSTPLLKGYFDSNESFEVALATIRESLPDLAIDTVQSTTLEDQDWKLAYRLHLKPWTCGALNWVPAWERESFETSPDGVYLYLDSGMAFGTGSHETTQLCAEALVAYAQEAGEKISNLRVIDAGCGSGILALSAVLLGFGEVHAFDRDPEAVRITLENAAENGLQDRLTVEEAGLEGGLQGRGAELIVANIQADVLRIYRDNIVSAWNPDGVIILSGILAQERANLTEVFHMELQKKWPPMRFVDHWEQKGDWVSVVFLKQDQAQ